MDTLEHGRLLAWGTHAIEENTLEQAATASRSEVVYDHVALMPDAHLGIGATVGSVIPTKEAIIPSAVGVDLGCGMAATRLSITSDRLADDLKPYLSAIEQVTPAGVGQRHHSVSRAAADWLAAHTDHSEFTTEQDIKAAAQFGTLGSGNHFVELSEDELGRIWIVLHSGSRGIGNQLATGHTTKAKKLAQDLELSLEDPDLAWFVQGTPEFEDYIRDMLWAQSYALGNRQAMLDAITRSLLSLMGPDVRPVETIQCHHNFAVQEDHGGQKLWITRKGAIRAKAGDRGIIPGSMGTATYLVTGRGNPLSWQSCSHGAGRRLSRNKSRKAFGAEDLKTSMKGITFLEDQAEHLTDEHPGAYKDIDAVMAAQADLVTVDHKLTQLVNFKG